MTGSSNRRLHMWMLAAVLAASPVAAKKRSNKASSEKTEDGLPRCSRQQRAVRAGTPVLGGPGLGFETLQVVQKTACFKTAETTEDGSFALIILEKEKKVGWVATGLVDARLSTGGAAGLEEAFAAPASGTVKAVRPIALRASPRFDALAVATPVAQNTGLIVKGRSSDGQWLLLEAPKASASAIDGVEVSAPEALLQPTPPGAVKAEDKTSAAAADEAKAKTEGKEADKPADGKNGDKKLADKKKGDGADASAEAAVGPLGGGPIGWAPKYKVAEVLLSEKDKPSAGTGGWAETRASRKSYEELLAARAADKASPSPGDKASEAAGKTASTDKAKEPNAASKDAKGAEAAADAKADGAQEGSPKAPAQGSDPAEGGDPEAPQSSGAMAGAPVLGRTQELGIAIGYRYWQQSYNSDAFLDGFYRYDWIAPAGVELNGHYAWRGDFPLVVEARGSVALSGWQHPDLKEQPQVGDHPVAIYAADGANPFIVLSPQVHLSTRVAWRLFSTVSVDVDAGGLVAVDSFTNFGLGEQAEPTLVHGFYGAVGPSLVARSRLGENGQFGLLIVEAQLPVGTYTMLPDPVSRYNGLPATSQVVPAPVSPGEDPTVAADRAEGLPFHLAAGIDGKVRYQYAVSHLFRIECAVGALLRQATIGGPGYRTGLYSQASNIDGVVSASVGATFGF